MGLWSVWKIAINDISFVISVRLSACPSVLPSVRPYNCPSAWNYNSSPTARKFKFR